MMKAARYHALSVPGEPSPIKLESIPIPAPSATCAVVKVMYASMNPVDLIVMSGALAPLGWTQPLPMTLGYDFSGTITSLPIGYTSSQFHIGDSVFAVNWGAHNHNTINNEGTEGGAFAEYISIPLSKLSKVPTGVALADAAATALVGTTAYEVLFTHGKVKAGQKVLILGGSTAVGLHAIQLAKLHGAHVYTTASTRNTALVNQFSPDLVINYEQHHWNDVPEVRDVDFVYDTIGTPGDFAKAKAVLKPGASFMSIANTEVGFNPTGHPPLALATFFTLSNNPATQDALMAAIAEGKLKVIVDEVFPFTDEGVAAMVAKVEGKKAQGKVLLKIGV